MVRVLQDAVEFKGLLLKVIRHLYGTWEACTGRARKETWMGRALKMIQRVWPAFRITLDHYLSSGALLAWNSRVKPRYVATCSLQAGFRSVSMEAPST